MSRARILLMLLFSVLVVGAIGSASASAFTVLECAKVAAGTGLYEDAKCSKDGGSKEWKLQAIPANTLILGTSGLSMLTSEVLSIKTDIHCLKDHFDGLLQPSGLSQTTIKFLECQLYTLSGGVSTLRCVLPNIVAEPHGELVTGPKDKFVPKSGEVFTTILTGSNCNPLSNQTLEVKGEITCQLPSAESDLVEHEIECTEADTGLKLGKVAATLKTTEKVMLGNGNAFVMHA